MISSSSNGEGFLLAISRNVLHRGSKISVGEALSANRNTLVGWKFPEIFQLTIDRRYQGLFVGVVDKQWIIVLGQFNVVPRRGAAAETKKNDGEKKNDGTWRRF